MVILETRPTFSELIVEMEKKIQPKITPQHSPQNSYEFVKDIQDNIEEDEKIWNESDWLQNVNEKTNKNEH